MKTILQIVLVYLAAGVIVTGVMLGSEWWRFGPRRNQKQPSIDWPTKLSLLWLVISWPVWGWFNLKHHLELVRGYRHEHN